MQKNKSIFRVAGMSITSSVLFFVVTNFFVWVEGFFHQPALYPLDFSELVQCYTMANPFIDAQLLPIFFTMSFCLMDFIYRK